MNRTLPTFLCLVFITHAALASSDPARREYPADSVLNIQIHSRVLGQDRDLIIHLPPGHGPSKKYPVIYVLDGSSQDQHIADTFDSLSALGLVPQTIVVGIPNMSGANRILQLVPPFMLTDPAKPESPPGTGDTFLSFMEEELIPFMAEKYGASGLRSFAGNSRGGLLVLYSLIHKPDLFAARFCFSTPIWRQDNLLVSRVGEFLSSKKTPDSFLYLSVGANETEEMKSGLQAMDQWLRKVAPPGLVWYTSTTPGADHQSNAKVSARDAIQKWGERVRQLER